MKAPIADGLTLFKGNIIHTFFVGETASNGGGNQQLRNWRH